MDATRRSDKAGERREPISVFEIIMLACFGAGWPISIAEAQRTKVVSGKSPLFMGIICSGYACGLVHKLVYSMDWVIALYAVNLLLVTTDLALYFRYVPREDPRAGRAGWAVQRCASCQDAGESVSMVEGSAQDRGGAKVHEGGTNG